jgi:hypothetical protein
MADDKKIKVKDKIIFKIFNTAQQVSRCTVLS